MKQIKVKDNPVIATFDKNDNNTGYLIPIFNNNDNFLAQEDIPKQVYCTVVNVKSKKGPHLHFKRSGYFTCIKGNIKIVIKVEDNYEEYFSGEDYNYRSIFVPAGFPVLIINIHSEKSYVLNMPSPAWHKDQNDDFNADFSDYKG